MALHPGAALTVALVTGSKGQDGTYLVELLEERGYEVAGLDRGDVDPTSADALLRDVAPREVYNLASPTFVPASWDAPVETLSAAALTGALLAAIARVDPAIRFFQASSAEVFGLPDDVPQTETTRYRPQSPYAAAKACSDYLVAAYRAQYGLHASSGILFNHESPRRPAHFLPAKIARAAAAREPVALGDLDARRDWGYAPDYVRAMWLMLQQEQPDDYVIATGEAHSVRDLAEVAYAHVGLDWREYVHVDEALVRNDARVLVGDATKARERLGWSPSVTFEELVHLLVDEAAP